MLFSRKDGGSAVPSGGSTPAPGAAPSPAAPAVNRTGVFLGSLRSEVDEPDQVPEPFAELSIVHDSIMNAYRRGTLTGAQVGQRIKLLRLRTADGVEWTLGASSKRWYRRLPGGTWKIAIPPKTADEVAAASAQAALRQVALLDAPLLADAVRIAVTATGPDPEPAADMLPELADDEAAGPPAYSWLIPLSALTESGGAANVAPVDGATEGPGAGDTVAPPAAGVYPRALPIVAAPYAATFGGSGYGDADFAGNGVDLAARPAVAPARFEQDTDDASPEQDQADELRRMLDALAGRP